MVCVLARSEMRTRWKLQGVAAATGRDSRHDKVRLKFSANSSHEFLSARILTKSGALKSLINNL